MKLVLTGGTGFIGRALTQALLQEKYDLTVLTRQNLKTETPGDKPFYLHWDPNEKGIWEKAVQCADGVINLAGEPVSARWTPQRKSEIMASRIETTKAIVCAIEKNGGTPKILINASAVGYYGNRGDAPLTENAPPGTGFLAEVCKAWEAQAFEAQKSGNRVVIMRFGVVLEKNGGMLKRMLPPFRAGLGGPLGTGQQWISWIHRLDLIGLILFALKNSLLRGAINATAPFPVTMKEFSKTLGKVLRRPTLLNLPPALLKLTLGEMAEMLLSSQKALPQKVQKSGYPFIFPSLRQALENCLTEKG